MKNEKIIFFRFCSEKYGKMSKEVKNEKMGQKLMKKVKIDEKYKVQYFLGFSGKYGKMSKKVKMLKKGQILMRKVKIDEK